MQTYTVIGFYRDNRQPFTASVQAHDPRAATVAGVDWALDINGWGEDYADLIEIVAVLMGDCERAINLGGLWNGAAILAEHNAIVDVMASYSA